MKIVTHLRLRGKGQVTLPAKLRSAFKLEEGSELIVMATDREIILRPKIAKPLEKFGVLGKEKGFTRVKDLIWKYEQKGQK